MPEDPMILLSYVNTQLRDNYSSLKDLCQALGADQNALEQKLQGIDYHYDPDLKQFV